MGFVFEEREVTTSFPGKIQMKDESRGESVRLHYHSSLELNLFDRVKGTVTVGSSTFRLAPEETLVIPPGVLHSYRLEASRGGRVDVFHIKLPALSGWIVPDAVTETLRGIEYRCRSDRFRELLSGYTRPGTRLLEPLQALSFLFSVMSHLPKRRGASGARLEGERGGPAGKLKRVVDYVEAEYSGRPRLEEAARIAAYSRSGFTRFFRNKTGLSFHEFVIEVRLEHAMRMLDEGLPVTGTAHAAGFTDASHFIRVFKDRLGYTPRRYQRFIEAGPGRSGRHNS